MQKTHNITNRKCLLWCELINPYNFFSLSTCFTIRHGKRLGETLKFPRVSGASRSRPVSRKLQRLFSVSSRTKFWTSRSCLGLGNMGLGSRLGFGLAGLVHIPATWVDCVEKYAWLKPRQSPLRCRSVHLVAAGLSGTQTAPSRWTASKATGSSMQFDSSIQTLCRIPSPSRLSDAAQLYTCSTSCEYVYCLPLASSICRQVETTNST